MSEIKCKSTEHLRFLNKDSGEIIRVQCNTYACEYCGKRKVLRLRIALQKYLSQFEYVRMWTFTCTPRFSSSPKEHHDLMRKAWRIFTKELRRCNLLKEAQKKVQYVKTTELHKSGFVHFHAVFTVYIPWTTVQQLWEKSCQQILHTREHVSNCNVHALKQSAKVVANYLTKSVVCGAGASRIGAYMTKADDSLQNLSKLGKRVKRWSKSSRISIFEKRLKSGNFVLVKVRPDGSLNLGNVVSLEHVPVESHEIGLENDILEIEFDFGDEPPDDLLEAISAYVE